MDAGGLWMNGLRFMVAIIAKGVLQTPSKIELPQHPWFSQTQPQLVKTTVKESTITLANTQETTEELRRRLGKELYRMELDLQGGGRIANKPCDCLSKKHHLGIEATAEELMSYEHKPVYGEVINWLNQHAPEFEPSAIMKHDPEYYRALLPQVRAFRKDVMGTEKVTALLNPEQQARVKAKITELTKEVKQ